jgi:hypothetical protein
VIVRETRGSWLAANRALAGVLVLSVLFLAGALLLNRHRHQDITSSANRANCERLYSAAKTRPESLLVDGQVASALTERKVGFLRPDLRCGEVRAYDSARGR